MEEQQPPWWEINRPYMFVYPGEQFNPPPEVLNERTGFPICGPIICIKPVENPKSFKPWHVVSCKTENYFCNICKITKRGNHQVGNNSNAFSHVRTEHLEQYPINCWTQEEVTACYNSSAS